MLRRYIWHFSFRYSDVVSFSLGSNSDHDEEKLNAFLEETLSDGTVENGILATSPSKMHHIWGLRERIAEALLRDGYCYKYDISLPLTKVNGI
jgi:FAD/FMN-containing dehydrogenase